MPFASRILCVVDPRSQAQPALQRAAWLARKTDATIELVICDYNDYLVAHPLFDEQLLERAREKMLSADRETLEYLAEPFRKEGLRVATDAIWDHPIHEGIIRRACRNNVDLVLKDTSNHSIFNLSSLSNTEWNLIRSCPMPLWLVKPRHMSGELRVIAAIDPMHSHDRSAVLDDAILRISNSMASTVGAEVHAFHSFDPRLIASLATLNSYVAASMHIKDVAQELEHQHRHRFQEIIESHGISSGRAHMIAGFVHRELPALAANIDAFLVVMGSVNRNPVKQLFIGSSAERTLDRLPCDLMVIKPDGYKTPVDLHIEAAA